MESAALQAFDTSVLEFWMRNDANPSGSASLLASRSATLPGVPAYWDVGRSSDGASASYDLSHTAAGGFNGWLATDVGVWHYYVVHWKDTGVDLWRDGSLIYSHYPNCCGESSRAGERIRIGNLLRAPYADVGARWSLDEVATYATNLVPERIAVHYAARNAPTNLTPPTITAPSEGGSPVYRHGTELTGVDGTWTGSPNPDPHWLRCRPDGSLCVEIPGANAVHYVPAIADIGATLRFRVVAQNADGDDPPIRRHACDQAAEA